MRPALDTRSTDDRRIIDLGRVGGGDVRVIGRYSYSAAQQPLAPHRHPGMLELCYLHRGTQTYQVRGRRYSLSGGDLFLTLPGEEHGTGGSPEEKGLLYWLILRLPGQGRPFLGIPAERAAPLLAALGALRQRHLRAGLSWRRRFDELFDAGQAATLGDPLAVLRLQAGLTRLLLDVVALSNEPSSRAVSDPIRQVLSHVERHWSEAFSVPTLARVAGLSVPRFKARFRQEVGVPPAEYVLRRRLERAKALLQRGGRAVSVTRIAYDLNFCSSQHFATAFKRLVGISPREFLRRR